MLLFPCGARPCCQLRAPGKGSYVWASRGRRCLHRTGNRAPYLTLEWCTAGLACSKSHRFTDSLLGVLLRQEYYTNMMPQERIIESCKVLWSVGFAASRRIFDDGCEEGTIDAFVAPAEPSFSKPQGDSFMSGNVSLLHHFVSCLRAGRSSLNLLDVTLALLRHKAVDVNARDELGNTPLHALSLLDIAVTSPLHSLSASFAHLLLDHGADTLCCNNEGQSAQDAMERRPDLKKLVRIQPTVL